MRDLNPGEYGQVENNAKCMRGMIRAENTETAKGYQLASGEYTVDGSPQFPLWTVIDSGSTPLRLTTLEVLRALISTYDDNMNEQYTVVMAVIDLLSELKAWATHYEEKVKNKSLYLGAIFFETAEAYDFITEVAGDWKNWA